MFILPRSNQQISVSVATVLTFSRHAPWRIERSKLDVYVCPSTRVFSYSCTRCLPLRWVVTQSSLGLAAVANKSHGITDYRHLRSRPAHLLLLVFPKTGLDPRSAVQIRLSALFSSLVSSHSQRLLTPQAVQFPVCTATVSSTSTADPLIWNAV
jgi:hypothetical protein